MDVTNIALITSVLQHALSKSISWICTFAVCSKFLLDYRRTINSTTQSLSELRWYTAAITILIKWVNRDIYMGGDNGGDLWRYFVAYELILQGKDAIG